jgi:cobalt/nickel transport protein
MSVATGDSWLRGAMIGLVVLVVLAPVFGWAAGAVGYAEPLENAAELTGAADGATSIVPAVFPDYSVPGVGGSLGTLLSAAIGTALTLGVAIGAGRLLEQ